MTPPNTNPPTISGMFETVLYTPSVPEAAQFFQSVLGLSPLRPPTANSAVFRINPESMLLLFNPVWSEQPGRGAPIHGSRGQGHLALRIPIDSYDRWKSHLNGLNVPIESEIQWEPGGRSIYIRDPANNSIELAAGDVWGP